MTTPTPGSAGTPDRDDSTRDDPTREVELDHPTQALPSEGGATEPVATEAQPSAHTEVFGTQGHDQAAWAPGQTAWTPAGPVTEAPVTAAPVTGDPVTAGTVTAPKRPTGPHLPPVLLGIVCLAIAGLAIWQEVTDVQVDWGNVGPLGIVAIGALLVVLGLVGLLGSRRHSRP
ncbi:hypothetical protein GCM10027517_00090 [Phycicoccus ginsengisoli]